VIDNPKTKIVIAISHADEKPWSEIKIAQETTWITNHTIDSQVIFYLSKPAPLILRKYDKCVEKYRFSKKYGRFISKLNYLSGKLISHKIPMYWFTKKNHELIVNSWSTYQLQGRRSLALFDWFINFTQADFLLQTNSSSYFKIDNLMNQLEKFDGIGLVYAGAIINPHDSNFPIVSGAGKLLSRELVLEILKNSKMLKFDNLEDVALAELISNLGVKPFDLGRLDLPNLATIEKHSNEELRSHFHFRCKSDSNPRVDSQIMQELHSRLSGKSDE
jgi:hypothetical protein